MIDTKAPFILFDDARDEGAGPALLYRAPARIVEARTAAQVPEALRALRGARKEGLHAAGFLGYEAGYALEPRLAALARTPMPVDLPLLWFGLFEGREEIAPDLAATRLGSSGGAWTAPPLPLVAREDYDSAFATVRRHIFEGDIYQANLTFPAEVRFGGDPRALYAALRSRARAGHGALLFTGSHWLLSFSPELFFTLEGRRASARPMKGTATRSRDPIRDAAAARALAADEKQRAENLMIVDLVRNDLSRVAKAGSVEVPALFRVETYPTVHQMVSLVTAELEEGRDAVDLLAETFPCGSVTGAPKIRAMELIAAVEPMPRGAYTGSIGWIAPSGDASFNVAIRTLSLRAGEGKAAMGLGSGVVADSRAGEEWGECLAKGAFVSGGTADFDLVETMGFDPDDGIVEIERHLERMKVSAEALGFAFDRHDARNELQAATFRFREPRRLRLRLSRTGSVAIETRPMPDHPREPVTVAIAPLPAPASDVRFRHKTSDRSLYEGPRKAAGTFEVVFIDEEGFVTQGSFTNVFAERDGVLLTPPLSRPVLPGVLRERLIEDGEAKEAELRAEDLAGTFYVGNDVRGLMRARLAQ